MFGVGPLSLEPWTPTDCFQFEPLENRATPIHNPTMRGAPTLGMAVASRRAR